MRRARTVVLGLATLVLLSCSSIAPLKVTAGDQCFRCRRTIVDTRLAAEKIEGGFVSTYRAPGCMVKYLVAHPDETGRIFVTDYATGKMISPNNAVFVPVVMDRHTMESDYRAYKRRVDADAAAAELGTTPVDWPTVLSSAR